MPYLSPLVLRKELENLLINNGDIALQECEIVKNKPILFWNLVGTFSLFTCFSEILFEGDNICKALLGICILHHELACIVLLPNFNAT